MKALHSRAGKIFAASYLSLYAVSGIYAVGFLWFHRPTAYFDPPAIAALPWTFVILPLVNSWGMTSWYQRHAGSPVLYGAAMTLIYLPGALLNATVLYWFVRILDGFRKDL